MSDERDRRQHVPQPGDVKLADAARVAQGAADAAALARGIIAAAHQALFGPGDRHVATFVVPNVRGLDPDERIVIRIARERHQELPE